MRRSDAVYRALTLASLALNVVILAGLGWGYLAVRRTAGRAADQLAALGQQTIRTSVRIDQTMPIRLNVPIRESLRVPVEQNLPIDTSLQILPVLPLIGPIKLDVPVRASIPVRFTIPVEISTTVPVVADVPVQLDVPVVIRVSDTALKPALDQIISVLNSVAGR